MAHTISHSRRLRNTPFTEGVEATGVKAYTVYNRMLLPTVFRSVEEDYHHLKTAVQVWDVACERQVELRGPDAGKLMQMLTPRDLPVGSAATPRSRSTSESSPPRTAICSRKWAPAGFAKTCSTG